MKFKNTIILLLVLLSLSILGGCVGTKIPAISQNMIVDDLNFTFDPVDKSLKVNPMQKCDWRGGKWQAPPKYFSNYQVTVAEPFNNSVKQSIENLKFFSKVVDKGITDYELTMELLFDYYYLGKFRGALTKYGVSVLMNYELRDRRTGITHYDSIITTYVPNKNVDGKKSEWLARTAEKTTKENLKKYFLQKSILSEFSKNENSRLKSLQRFLALYVSNSEFQPEDMSALISILNQEKERNNPLSFDNEVFKVITNFQSYAPTSRKDYYRPFYWRNVRSSIQECYKLTERYEPNSFENAYICFNIIKLINEIYKNDWEEFFPDKPYPYPYDPIEYALVEKQSILFTNLLSSQNQRQMDPMLEKYISEGLSEYSQDISAIKAISKLKLMKVAMSQVINDDLKIDKPHHSP